MPLCFFPTFKFWMTTQYLSDDYLRLSQSPISNPAVNISVDKQFIFLPAAPFFYPTFAQFVFKQTKP